MFEDFAFPSTTLDPDHDRVMVDCNDNDNDNDNNHPGSSLISPLSSQCPSPKSFYRPQKPVSLSRSRSSFLRSTSQHGQQQQQQHQQPPTSVPFDHQERFSITTLTRRLHEHTLNNPESTTADMPPPVAPAATRTTTTSNLIRDITPPPSSRFRLPGYFLTPPDTDQDDEGLCDSSSVTSSQPSSAPQSPSFPNSNHNDNFNMSVDLPPLPPLSDHMDMIPTLQDSREPDLCPDYYYHPTGAFHVQQDNINNNNKEDVRARRQQISRLQCGANTTVDAVRHALEEDLFEPDPSSVFVVGEGDECHPSSLPPQLSPSPSRSRRLSCRRSRSGPVPVPVPVQGPMRGQSGRGAMTRTRTTTTTADTSCSSHNNELVVPDYFSGSCRRRRGSAVHAHRVDKNYGGRDSRKRSDQGLRRKSLVSAALASMVERGSEGF